MKDLHKKMTTERHLGFTVTQDGLRLLGFFNGKRNILLTTTLSLLSLLGEARVVHADATYKVVPGKICKQLFTIHGNWGGYVGMVACALMNSADSKAYEWVFQRLKEAVPGLTIIWVWDKGDLYG